jgi:uncharacterized membrane protein YvbJ
VECANCGGQVPDDGRFCPYCGAPQRSADEAVEPEDAPAEKPARTATIERVVFGALLLVTAAIVVLAVLVFGFGFWVEEATSAAPACNYENPAYSV